MSCKSVRRGSVIHSFAAARFFLERFHSTDSFSSFRDMTAELLAYSTGAITVFLTVWIKNTGAVSSAV